MNFIILFLNISSSTFDDSEQGLNQWERIGDKQRQRLHPTPVLLPGKSHGRRSLVGCSPWGLKESDVTEQLHFHFSLSCIGEGNGNPFQCSCPESPRDGGAWWAAVYGVVQSRTRLMDLQQPEQRQHKGLGCQSRLTPMRNLSR